jgi:hypothetical protein
MLLIMKPKLLLASGMFCTLSAMAQNPIAPAIYDEAKVPAYTLPDPLVCADGTRVTSVSVWKNKRRPELLRLFEKEVYGRAPERPNGMRFETVSVVTNALNGLATRKEITVWFTGKTDGPNMSLLLYTPNVAKKPVPALLGLNFNGNHAVTTEPDVRLSDRWMVSERSSCIVSNHATAACRGIEATRWQVERILARGYALATVYYGDLEPDFASGWKTGVRAALSPAGTNTTFKPDEWGAIGAWAWGLSRALDYLETDGAVDAKRVAVIGHSRLGKTALWAGARDERFAIVISNDSGEGGAALARRRIGERTANLNRAFPHWFCGNFKQYDEREEALPVDQHELITLIAPRPVYIASAEEDRWADPRGEFLAAKAAEPVYDLFAKAGLDVAEPPAVNKPVGDFIRYHLRSGKHDITDYDWEQYLNFADRHFKR